MSTAEKAAISREEDCSEIQPEGSTIIAKLALIQRGGPLRSRPVPLGLAPGESDQKETDNAESDRYMVNYKIPEPTLLAEMRSVGHEFLARVPYFDPEQARDLEAVEKYAGRDGWLP